MIHGIDRNPLAVELCRVALWIEALEPGRPLSFLDDRIVCGDALIGVFDLAVLKDGIPDPAYDDLTGDDKDAARTFRRWNRETREGVASEGLLKQLRPPADLVDEARRIAAMPEETLAEIEAKRLAFERLNSGEPWRRRKNACDLYIAAFFVPKPPFPTEEAEQRELRQPRVPLTEHVWTAARGGNVWGPLVAVADGVAHDLRVLHWPLAFPVQMARGGFDAVIGNPPWERIKLQEQEFFNGRAPAIANATNAAARQKMIAELGEAPEESSERRLFDAFRFAKRAAEAASVFVRSGIRYPRTGVGDVNTYALFAELFATAVHAAGRAGVIVPTGIATDSSTSAFFGWLIDQHRLARLIDFENRRGIFPGVHKSYKFSVLALASSDEAEFAFYLLDPADLENDERQFTLTPAQIARINPNTKTAPIFRSRTDADLTAKIFDRVPVLIREAEDENDEENPWGLSFQRMFDMSNDSSLFQGADDLAAEGWWREGPDWVSDDGARYVPLYEAKMIHHFDHRWATYGGGNGGDEEGARDVTLAEKRDPGFEPEPRYWVPAPEVRLRAARVSAALKGAVRRQDRAKALKALADHVAAAVTDIEGREAGGEDLTRALGREQAWQEALKQSPDLWAANPRNRSGWPALQRKLPLTRDDLLALADAGTDPLRQAEALIDRKQPRWLMGWRRNARSSDERTFINALLPKAGIGDSLFLEYLPASYANTAAILISVQASIIFDFIVRQKLGGTNVSFYFMEQFATPTPESFYGGDIDLIKSAVLELTFTTHTMQPWAEDLGHSGPPFAWDPERRALLRAELDGFFARKYGLNRDELRYVLDPTDTHGPDHPSETFRILRDKEIAAYGEYRTRRLVLEAYDRLEGVT